MQSKGFKKMEKDYDIILAVCLENNHINMIITKICGMISTKKIKSLTFVTVDNSPHCIQLHYTKKEIERVMDKIHNTYKNYCNCFFNIFDFFFVYPCPSFSKYLASLVLALASILLIYF